MLSWSSLYALFLVNFTNDYFYVYFCLEFPVEAPIDSMKTTKLTNCGPKSLGPITETGKKVQLDIVKVDSPELQYNQDNRSSSRNEGRIFLFFFSFGKSHYREFCLLLHECVSFIIIVLELHFMGYFLYVLAQVECQVSDNNFIRWFLLILFGLVVSHESEAV